LRAWSVVVAVGVSLCTAGSAEARDFKAVMAEAIAARDAGDLERTLALLREAHALQPRPELQNNIGKILEELGRYAEAAEAYTVVVDDRAADEKLRALDAARLRVVRPKSRLCWLFVSSAAEARRVLVDGDQPEIGEAEYSPEFHFFEMRSQARGEVSVMVRTLPRGRRVAVADVVKGSLSAQARLHFAGLTSPPKGVRIDGYRVRAPMADAKVIYVEPGRRFVEVELAEGPWIRREVELVAGQPIDVVEWLEVDAAAGVSPWSALLIGAGAGAAAAGGTLLSIASSERSRVTGAEQLDGRVVGLSHAEALTIEERADDRATAGAVLLGVGSAALTAGLVWLIVSAL